MGPWAHRLLMFYHVLPIQNDEFPQWSHDRGRCDHLLWIAGDSQHHLGFRRISPEFSEVDSMCTWKYNPPHTFAVQTTLCYPGANIDVENHNFNRYFIQEWVIFHSSVSFPTGLLVRQGAVRSGSGWFPNQMCYGHLWSSYIKLHGYGGFRLVMGVGQSFKSLDQLSIETGAWWLGQSYMGNGMLMDINNGC